MGNIESAVRYMVNIANDDSHGYDQIYRTGGVDFDCSSLVGTALNVSGFNVKKSSTTRTLRKQLLDCGFKSIGVGASRKRGDIFLKEGYHVVMCIDANNIVHASINEKGTTTGGKQGDQTGKEICTRSFYVYKNGWDYCFRYEDKGTSNTTTQVSASKPSTPTVKSDAWISALQTELNKQYHRGLVVDGIKGIKTLNACPTVKKGAKGNITRLIQQRLNSVGFNLVCDGDFGDKTRKAVIVFQRNRGLTQDGIVGQNTWSWLLSGTRK